MLIYKLVGKYTAAPKRWSYRKKFKPSYPKLFRDDLESETYEQELKRAESRLEETSKYKDYDMICGRLMRRAQVKPKHSTRIWKRFVEHRPLG